MQAVFFSCIISCPAGSLRPRILLRPAAASMKNAGPEIPQQTKGSKLLAAAARSDVFGSLWIGRPNVRSGATADLLYIQPAGLLPACSHRQRVCELWLMMSSACALFRINCPSWNGQLPIYNCVPSATRIICVCGVVACLARFSCSQKESIRYVHVNLTHLVIESAWQLDAPATAVTIFCPKKVRTNRRCFQHYCMFAPFMVTTRTRSCRHIHDHAHHPAQTAKVC